MKTNRLLRLASLLDNYQDSSNVPEFYLGSWGDVEHKRKWLFGHKVSCNTTACAVGLACLSGEFDADGLEYMEDESSIWPVFAGQKEWFAVQVFFGLTSDQSYDLFDMRSYDGAIRGAQAAKEVSARIRELVQTSFPANAPPKLERHKAAVEAIKESALAKV